MAISFDKASMRVHFKELGARREEILAASKPIRDQIAGLRLQQDQLRAQIKELAQQARTIEKDLFEIDQDRAQIARILGGKTAIQG